jgi:hypothetical protein
VPDGVRVQEAAVDAPEAPPPPPTTTTAPPPSTTTTTTTTTTTLPATVPPTLPRTGSGSRSLTRVAAIVFAGGAFAVLAATPRRRVRRG